MAAPAINPLTLALAAGGAYLAFTADGRALVADLLGSKPAAAPPAAPRAAPAMPMASDPYSAIIQTVGGIVQSLLPELSDPDSAPREGLRNFDKARRDVFAKVGLTGDPDRKKKNKERAAAMIAAGARDMELFAARVHDAARRSDVHEWVIDTPETGHVIDQATGKKSVKARISIYYFGRDGKPKKPYVLFVPESLRGQQLAAIAEPIVRATGGWVQRGGRLANGAPFVYYVDEENNGARVHAYSDTNPFAPKDLMIGQILGARRSDAAKDQALSKRRKKLSPSARSALDQRVAANLKAGRPVDA